MTGMSTCIICPPGMFFPSEVCSLVKLFRVSMGKSVISPFILRASYFLFQVSGARLVRRPRMFFALSKLFVLSLFFVFIFSHFIDFLCPDQAYVRKGTRLNSRFIFLQFYLGMFAVFYSYYCTLVALVPCPPGTYGDSTGLNNASCSGECAAGNAVVFISDAVVN